MHGDRTPNSFRNPSVVNIYNADKGTTKKSRKRHEKQSKLEEPVQHSDEICEFCSKEIHSQVKFFSCATASKATVEDAAAKKEKHSKKAGAMLATTQDVSGDDFPIHKVAYHLTCLIVGGSIQFSPSKIVLDTGVNGSIVHKKSLLHDIQTKAALTANGIAGALTTKKAGAFSAFHVIWNHPAHGCPVEHLKGRCV